MNWSKMHPDGYEIQKVGDGWAFIHKTARISSGGEIGRFSYISNDCVIGGRFPVKIGAFCSIAPDLYCWTCDGHQVDYVTTSPVKTILGIDISYSELIEKENGVVIGNDVWIGNQVRIMAGVTIGNGAVVASRALVTKDVLPYGIYGGVPARLIRMRYPQFAINLMDKIQWWNWSVEKLIRNKAFFNLRISDAESEDDILSVIVD